MADQKNKNVDISDLVFEGDSTPPQPPHEIDIGDLSFKEETPAPQESLWQKTKGTVGKIIDTIIPSKTPMSEDEYGYLQKRDDHATVPSVAIGDTEIPPADPKWKAHEREDGSMTTLPDTPEIGREIAPGVREVSAPERPEVDALTQWKRGLLSKTTDVKTNVANAKRMFEQGGYDLVGVTPHEDGSGLAQTNVYLLEKDGNQFIIDEGDFDSALWDIAGDPASAALTVTTGGLARIAGAGALGNVIDQTISKLVTGEELSPEQRAFEVGKEAVLFGGGEATGRAVGAAAGGIIRGAKGIHTATATMRKWVDMAKKLDIGDLAQKSVIDDMAKLPEANQQAYLDALLFAKENDIRLTSTSVLDHPQVDQFVQVVARNPFIRQSIKNTEAESREKVMAKVMDVLETAGPKATPEELDPLLKQELGAALDKRNAQVRGLYDDFEKKASGDVVTLGKSLSDDVARIGDKYGFRENGGKILDEEVSQAEKWVKRILKPRISKRTLDVQTLDRLSSALRRRAEGYKVSNPKLQSYYSEMRQSVDDEIAKLSSYQGDEVLQSLRKARDAYRQKVSIYGSKSEYSDIRKAMESDKANEALHRLLTGEKALDNANMLKQELGDTETGQQLIGALGRQIVDRELSGDVLKSPSQLGRVLASDKMRIAKRLLGEQASKTIDDAATLLQMMGRTENLLKGTGAAMAQSSDKSLMDRALYKTKDMFVRFQQKRIVGKVFDNTIAQDMLLRTLKAASKAKTPKEFKTVDQLLNRTARTVEKELHVDMSDIYDKQKSRTAYTKAVKAERAENDTLKREVKRFVKPETEELIAVGKRANNDDVVLLNQAIGRIQQDSASEADIARYLKARKSLEGDKLDAAIDKERVLRLPQQYKEEDIPVAVEEISRLRDYLMSHPELQYGAEFSPQSVKALLADLQEQGYPRSTAHDKLYKDLREMHAALKGRIDDAYPQGVPLDKADPDAIF